MLRGLFIAIIWFKTVLLYAQVKPIPHAHAHNDYVHPRPLHDALDNGFTSIEADVYLHNGNLVVSHLPLGLNRKKTLETLYLEPLKEVVIKNKGRVYEGYDDAVTLMIDFKGTGNESYAKLKQLIQPYLPMLTVYKNGKVLKQGAVNLLISGAKPFAAVQKEDTTYVLIDAGIGQMGDKAAVKVSARFSDPYQKYFSWKGKKTMPLEQKNLLDSLVHRAQVLEKDIRFYHIPDKPAVWRTLLDAGVTWINTDKLLLFRTFYNREYKKPEEN